MKYNLGTLLGVVGVTTAATLLGVGEAQAIILIDDFSEGAFDETLTAAVGNNFTVTKTGLSSVLGGARTVFSEVTSVTGGGNNSSVNVNTGNKEFNINEGSGVNLETLITYDSDGTGLGGIDFSGQSGIRFNTISSVGLQTDITLTDLSGFTSTLGSSSVTGGTSVFNFGSFTGDPGFNLAEINKVEVSLFSEGTGVSSTIAQIDSPPEAVPFNAESWVGLALLGTWGSWKYLKKRNQQKFELTASDEN